MSLSKKDQAELRRIIKASFELLDQDITQREREREIRATIRQELKEQGKAALQAAKVEFRQIVQEARELERRAQAIVDKHSKEGVGFRYGRERNIIEISDRMDEVRLADLDDQIERAFEQVRIAKGAGAYDLKRQKLALERELAVGAIEGDEARVFLAKIPDVNTLLPSPKAAKELVASL